MLSFLDTVVGFSDLWVYLGPESFFFCFGFVGIKSVIEYVCRINIHAGVVLYDLLNATALTIVYYRLLVVDMGFLGI